MALIMAKWETLHEALKSTDICPICGKKFISAADHMWKIGGWGNISGIHTERVCSYSCMRKWEKEREAEDKKRRRARRKN